MRRHNNITKSMAYRGCYLYGIGCRTRNKVKKGFYTEILDGLIDGVEDLLSYHSRINVIRFDLLFKDGNEYIELSEDTNRLVSDFFRILRRKIKGWKKKGKNRRIKNLFYGWVREESKGKMTHYHCAIAFPAQSHKRVKIYDSETQEYLWVYKIITDAWNQVCSAGHVNFGSRNVDENTGEEKQVNEFYFLKREDRNNIYDALKGLSYLAKVSTKESQPKHGRMFNFSRRIGKAKGAP